VGNLRELTHLSGIILEIPLLIMKVKTAVAVKTGPVVAVETGPVVETAVAGPVVETAVAGPVVEMHKDE